MELLYADDLVLVAEIEEMLESCVNGKRVWN